MFRFKLQNYNEFKNWVRWHDYVSVVIHEFALFLVRRYDWLDDEKSTFVVTLFGFTVYQSIWQWGMTAEEADAEYDAAPAIPMSKDEINTIVENVTGRKPLDTFTIVVKGNKATIRELSEDQDAVHQGHTNAEALGHAMFHLSCVADLEHGVKLDITQDE